jgi:hypothetical protein
LRLEGLTREDDFLLHQLPESFATSLPAHPRWFERLYFNLHDAEGEVLLIAGFGVFPNVDVADAYVVALDGTAQRNVRIARALDGRRSETKAGPLELQLIEPMRTWRLRLAETEGIAFDVTFEARTDPYSVGLIEFKRDDGDDTAFRHYNQSGRYTGWVRIDGREHDVEGWLGQRDHSWGLRFAKERLGLHFWVAAQFPDRAFMASYNETRSGEVTLCEGAVMFADDRPAIPVRDLRHELTLTEEGHQAQHARLWLILEGGEQVELQITPTLPDLYMAGAGYGGWQGQHRGELHVESETWEHATRPGIDAMDISIVDQYAMFEWEGTRASGVLEMGISRSSSYEYSPRPAGGS